MIDLVKIKDSGGPWVRAEIIGDQLLIQGDCREVMKVLPRVDAVLTERLAAQRIAELAEQVKRARDRDIAALRAVSGMARAMNDQALCSKRTKPKKG